MVPSWLLVPQDRLSPANTLPVCEEALKVWQTEEFDLLLVSGGVYMAPPFQRRPAAEIMHDWFVEHGISSERIILEPWSVNTYDNIRFSLDELAYRKIDASTITVCTQPIHGRRIRHTFRRAYGIDVALHPVRLHLGVEWFWQWLCAIYHYLDPRGTGWIARRTRAKRRAKTYLVRPA